MMPQLKSRTRFGFSIVGLLITMACIVVLASILLTGLNKAVTGEGSAVDGTVRSFEDKMYLTALYQSMAVAATETRGEGYLTPNGVSGSKDVAENNTANLFSAMVMRNYTTCHQLFSGNEYSGYVQEKVDYDFTAHNPAQKVFWDRTFKGDLADLSNTSFAHQPLYGDRFDDGWKATLNSRWPLIGNRGPKDGVENPQSYTYGRNGKWGGHIVFGDGHVEFVESFIPNGLTCQINGETLPDNIFKVDTKPNGPDAVLAFTKIMTKQGPTLQWD
jgi:prepilin-type processing-associated H-X9-DG protein